MKQNVNKQIRTYIRENPHLTDDIIADVFNVSKRSVSANKAHVTMGTDTDSPQGRAKSIKKAFKRGLTLIKTNTFELRINESGVFSRLDLIGKKSASLSDDEAKAIMLTQIKSL